MNLKSKCLVARPSIVDSHFKKSVVFVFDHTPHGTAGVVLNKRQNLNTQLLCHNKGFDTQVPSETVYIGGPVNTSSVCMLHTSDWRSSNTIDVNDSICISSDDMMFHKYCNGDTAFHYKWFTGHSVWHPRQIQMEMNSNHWLVTELNTEQIFETDSRHIWDLAVETAAQEMMDKFI
jgi:putative transcriptional regulator